MFEMYLTLRDTVTARIIWQKLPIQSEVNKWGDEIYFYVPFACDLENDAKDIINQGEIAFWTEGRAIAIGFGPTPISEGNEIRLAAKCNIWADTTFELKKLSDTFSQDNILIKKL